ncbi:hypothetical protein BH11BAC5_BH11BAC5_28690 [soil metagenome]
MIDRILLFMKFGVLSVGFGGVYNEKLVNPVTPAIN